MEREDSRSIVSYMERVARWMKDKEERKIIKVEKMEIWRKVNKNKTNQSRAEQHS